MADKWILMYGILLLVSVALLVVSVVRRKKGLWIATVVYDIVGLVFSVYNVIYYSILDGRHTEEGFSSIFACGAFSVLLYISLLLWVHLPKPSSNEK